MPYLGKSPAHGNFTELTDVSGSFNGSTTQFALTDSVSSTAITPVVSAALLISINGVIQEPTTDYTVSGTNITFTSAPASTDSFFGVVMGFQLDVGTPSDSTVTAAKLASTFFTGATDIGAAIVDADLLLLDDGAGGTIRKTTASRLKTYIGGNEPSSADGQALGSATLEWSDLYLADGGVIYLGNDQDVTLTHVADTGVLLNSTRKIQFGDSASFIHQSADGVLTIDGEATIDLNASTAVLASNDLKLNSDAAILGFGADNDVTLTHVADTGILLNSTMQLQFNDSSQYINAPSNAILDINATDEIELNATLADVNANLDVSGTYTGGGTMTTGGNIVIPDAGNIGSASDTDAIAIASNGVVTFSQSPVFPDGSINIADIDLDGGTDIGADIVDADLFLIDDGAGGTMRKTTAARLKTYAGGGGKVLQVQHSAQTTEVSSNSDSTYTDTGTTDDITPANASNKVLVQVSQHIGCGDPGGPAVASIRLLRGTTVIENWNNCSCKENHGGNFMFAHLDSPSTTSATTYHTEFKRLGDSLAGTVFINDNRYSTTQLPNSTITLIEIDGT